MIANRSRGLPVAAEDTPAERGPSRRARFEGWRRMLVALALLPLLASHASAQTRLAQVLRDALRPREPGTVWLVPGDGGARIPQPTIQAAVDAAANGDTVLLSDGIFRGPGNRGVVVSGKDLRIRSEHGPANCVIDCQRRDRGFFFTGPEVTAETILRGVTIVRGDAPDLLSPPGLGGGVFVDIDSSATIESCVIARCSAPVAGGGIEYDRRTSPRGTVRDCLLVGNQGGGGGGGIVGFSLFVDRCTIVDNEGAFGGGAFLQGNALVRDSVIARNVGAAGGGLWIDDAVRVESCTIVDNFAYAQAGGINSGTGPRIVVSNCILWGNSDDQILQLPTAATSTIRYCDIEDGAGGVFIGSPGAVELISILDVDPELVDRAGGDYHLTPSSPLIGAGDPTLDPGPTEGDHDGEPRANGPLDVGADEHYAGLALALPTPGRAGEANAFSVRGARPGELVFFFAGLEEGLLELPIEACPTLALGIADATLVAAEPSNARGEVRRSLPVPASLSATTVLLQAVGFDPTTPVSGCSVSNRIAFPFP